MPEKNHPVQIEKLRSESAVFKQEDYRKFIQAGKVTEEGMYYLSVLWADFHLLVEKPPLLTLDLPEWIYPQVGEDVYPILDRGNKLSASRGREIILAAYTLAKLFRTVDKMFTIMIERVQYYYQKHGGDAGGGGAVDVYFDGHITAKRRGFVILKQKVPQWQLMNFDPGQWAEVHKDLIAEDKVTQPEHYLDDEEENWPEIK